MDRQCRLPALRAERIASVPIKESAGLGIDGCLQGGQGRVHSAFDELEVAGFHGLDQLLASLFYSALRSDIQSKIRVAFINGPFEVRFPALIKAQEEELRDRDDGIVFCYEVFF